MKLTDDEPTSRPWRIHEIAGDFRLEDIWESLGIKPFLYLVASSGALSRR